MRHLVNVSMRVDHLHRSRRRKRSWSLRSRMPNWSAAFRRDPRTLRAERTRLISGWRKKRKRPSWKNALLSPKPALQPKTRTRETWRSFWTIRCTMSRERKRRLKRWKSNLSSFRFRPTCLRLITSLRLWLEEQEVMRRCMSDYIQSQKREWVRQWWKRWWVRKKKTWI